MQSAKADTKMMIPVNKPAFDKKLHWEQVYADKKSTEVSWYQQHPAHSLALLKTSAADINARIIDIGAGASTLVDYLLEAGYQNITVLDIAQAAINQAKAHLGDRANKVTWLEHDIADSNSPVLAAAGPFDVWHDRAVFHFLTEPQDRENYVHTMCEVLQPGAHVIMATFNIDGPEKCSGLDIVRYSPETISTTLGNSFQLVETSSEQHRTPSDAAQSFIYCRFLKL